MRGVEHLYKYIYLDKIILIVVGFTALFAKVDLAFAIYDSSTPRTTMVELFEWPWKDIAKECENYLGPNGFSAVHVSPPTEHLVWDQSPWWERYQPISYKILSRSGNEAEFKDMVERCHKSGVDIYVDVVLNHMAGIEDGHGQAGSNFTHYNYPGLYMYQDFHHCGRNGNDDIGNYNDRYEVQFCELVNLADLATESSYVQSKQAEFLQHLVDLGVKGFRVDAAKHIPAQDLQNIFNRVSGNFYVFQEVIASGSIGVNEYFGIGDVTVFSYAYDLGEIFQSRQFWRLPNFGYWSGYPASDQGVVFLENHDLQRSNDRKILTYKDGSLYRLANLFMLAWPYGYPRVFSGYSFASFNDGPRVDGNRNTLPVLDEKGQCTGNWVCEHRWQGIAAAANFRNRANRNFYTTNWWTNGTDQLAFGRGDVGFVAINASSNLLKQVFQTSLPQGRYCNIVDKNFDTATDTCNWESSFAVDSSGRVELSVASMDGVILQERTKIK